MFETRRFPIRIYQEDLGDWDIVYCATCLEFLESDRSDQLRSAGTVRAGFLNSEDVMFPMCRCDIDNLRTACWEACSEMHTQIRKSGGTSIDMGQDIHRGDDHIVGAKVRPTCVKRRDRRRRSPDQIHAVPNEIAISS